MNHNFKELLLQLGADKVMDTREIKKYFLDKTGINEWSYKSWWYKPHIEISSAYVFQITEFFNKEYEAMGQKRVFTYETLHTSDKTTREISKQLGLKKQEA